MFEEAFSKPVLGPVKITISSLSGNLQKKDVPNGSLLVRVENVGSQTTRIRFFNAAKGFRPSEKLAVINSSSEVSEFAQLKYVWRSNSAAQLSDTVAVGLPYLKLEAGRSAQISIPVKVPLEKGVYTFQMHFENKSLERNFYPTSELRKSDFCFGEWDDELQVIIKNK